MRRIFPLVLLLVLLACASCGKNAPDSPDDQEPCLEYPTTFYPLPEATLDSLKAAFAAQNPGICATLNEYGFPRRTQFRFPRGLSEEESLEDLIARAKLAVVANSRFTGVTDPSSLDPSSHTFLLLGERLVGIRCVFQPQVYRGLTVVGSHLYIVLDQVGAQVIDGNYYPEICIPGEPLVSATAAQDSIIGLEIEYWCWSVHDTFVVDAGSLLGTSQKVILVHELPGAIELRLAWQVPVGGGPSWYVYVDTMNGEVLRVRQVFFC